MGSNLFDLNYSDELRETIRCLNNPKQRKVFMIFFEEMEKDIKDYPQDYVLTFGEFVRAKLIN